MIPIKNAKGTFTLLTNVWATIQNESTSYFMADPVRHPLVFWNFGRIRFQRGKIEYILLRSVESSYYMTSLNIHLLDKEHFVERSRQVRKALNLNKAFYLSRSSLGGILAMEYASEISKINLNKVWFHPLNNVASISWIWKLLP